MKKILSIFCLTLFSNFLFSQNQIGSDIEGDEAGDFFGLSVSISAEGNRVAVGAPENLDFRRGYVRIYEENGDDWIQLGNDILGSELLDYFGYSVSISSDGKRVIIGAPEFTDGPGFVRVYKESGGVWTQVGEDIEGKGPLDLFGWSVSISSDGSRIAVGATEQAEIGVGDAGYVRIYEESGGEWIQIGNDLEGVNAGDRSGASVSLSSDGMIIAIGSSENENIGAGRVKVYKEIGGVWTQIGSAMEGDESSDKMGSSVSITSDGSRVAIGAPDHGPGGSRTGLVRIYEQMGADWTQIGEDIIGEGLTDESGGAVSLSADGKNVVIGATDENENGSGSGEVKVYQEVGGNWMQIGNDINGGMGDILGVSVSISSDGSRFTVGAAGLSETGGGSGYVRVYGSPDSTIVSLDNVAQYFSLKLSPNPVVNILTLEVNNELATPFNFSIKNMVGQEIFQKSYSNNDPIQVDMSAFFSGIYLIEIISGDVRMTEKIIKE